MSLIESAQNAKFKAWSALLEGRGIKKAGLAIVAGSKLVHEFVTQNPDAAEDLLTTAKQALPVLPKHVRVHQLSAPLFKELDVMGTKSPLLVVRTPALAAWKNETPNGLELIVALSDPGNLGALLRSAEAFGVTRVVLTQEAASPFLPKAIRASSGASLRMKLATTGPLADIRCASAYGLDMHGRDLGAFTWPKNLYLVLGEEGRGVPEELNLSLLRIDMKGKSESLNATTAAAIALFSYGRQH